MIVILGIDPGVKSGMSRVALNTNTGEIRLLHKPIGINLDSKDPNKPSKPRRRKGEKKEKEPIIYGKRLRRFGIELGRVMAMEKYDVIATEMPLVHSKQRGSGTLFLLQIYAMIALRSYNDCGRDPEMIGISTWKKIVAGEASKDKTRAHSAIKKLYPEVDDIKSTDALDSLCIAHAVAVRTYLECVSNITLDDYYNGNYDKDVLPWNRKTIFEE